MGKDRIKLFTLLFDELYFFNVADADELTTYIWDLYGDSSGFLKPPPKDVNQQLEKIWVPTERLGQPYYPEIGREHTLPSNELMNLVREQIQLEGTDLEPDFVWSEIMYWRKYFASSPFSGMDITDRVIAKIINNANKLVEPMKFELEIPSLGEISMKDVIDLRKSPFLCQFRKKYIDLSNTPNLPITALADEYHNVLEKIIDIVRPNTKNLIIKTILSQIPVPILNPVGLINSFHDIKKSSELESKYGWVFFVRDLKNV